MMPSSHSRTSWMVGQACIASVVEMRTCVPSVPECQLIPAASPESLPRHAERMPLAAGFSPACGKADQSAGHFSLRPHPG